jgi:hypothetical protein
LLLLPLHLLRYLYRAYCVGWLCVLVTSKTHHWVSAKASGRGRSSYGSWADRSRASRYISPPGSLIAPQGFVSIQYFTDISDSYSLCLTVLSAVQVREGWYRGPGRTWHALPSLICQVLGMESTIMMLVRYYAEKL